MILEDRVYDEIQQHCEKGDEYVSSRNFDKAIEEYGIKKNITNQ